MQRKTKESNNIIIILIVSSSELCLKKTETVFTGDRPVISWNAV